MKKEEKIQVKKTHSRQILDPGTPTSLLISMRRTGSAQDRTSHARTTILFIYFALSILFLSPILSTFSVSASICSFIGYTFSYIILTK